MKKRIPTFLAGMVTMALVGSFGVSALAATGTLTITVAPINIQVNGQTFQPKDAQGNSVPVFAYNGTTYAPLRALAEAYGLEVGYDAERNMATVGGSDGGVAPVATPAPVTSTPPVTPLSSDYSAWAADEEAAYQEFKGMWEVKVDGPQFITLTLFDEIPKSQHTEYFANTEENLVKQFSRKLSTELYQTHSVNSSGQDITGSTGAYISYRYLEAVLWIDDCYQWVDSVSNEIHSQSSFHYTQASVLKDLQAG